MEMKSLGQSLFANSFPPTLTPLKASFPATTYRKGPLGEIPKFMLEHAFQKKSVALCDVTKVSDTSPRLVITPGVHYAHSDPAVVTCFCGRFNKAPVLAGHFWRLRACVRVINYLCKLTL